MAMKYRIARSKGMSTIELALKFGCKPQAIIQCLTNARKKMLVEAIRLGLTEYDLTDYGEPERYEERKY